MFKEIENFRIQFNSWPAFLIMVSAIMGIMFSVIMGIIVPIFFFLNWIF